MIVKTSTRYGDEATTVQKSAASALFKTNAEDRASAPSSQQVIVESPPAHLCTELEDHNYKLHVGTPYPAQ